MSGDEVVNAYDSARLAAAAPFLSEAGMRELVNATFDIHGGIEVTADLMLALNVATKVLSRPDCPYALLLLAAMHPEWDTRLPGNILAHAVLARVDCPEEILAAVAVNEQNSDDPDTFSSPTIRFTITLVAPVLPDVDPTGYA